MAQIYLDSEKIKLTYMILDPQAYSAIVNFVVCTILDFCSAEIPCPVMGRVATLS